MNDRGVIHIILLAIVVIFLVIAVLIAIVWGLEGFSQENFSRSIFSDEANIKEFVSTLEEGKNDLLDSATEAFEKVKNSQRESVRHKQKTRPVSGEMDTVEDRLSDLKDRLNEREY